MTGRRPLAACVGLAIGIVTALTALVAGPGAQVAHADTQAARIVITSLSPSLVQQGDTVHVTGRITNRICVPSGHFRSLPA